MKMSLKLSEEQISSCRRGSDIDIEAIFGGHISGKRSPDVRVNPVFNEKTNKSDDHGTSELDSENNNIEILANQHTEIIADPHTPTNQHTETQSASPVDEATSMVTKEDRSERDSLQVSNGSVFVGDIVIENGYKNQGFEGDKVIESASQRITNQVMSTKDRKPTSVKDMVKFLDRKNSGSPLIISKNNNNESDWPDLDDITVSVVEVTDPNTDKCKHDNSNPSEKSTDTNSKNADVNHNTFQGDNEKTINKVDDKSHSESKENNRTSVDNGDTGPDSSVLKDKDDSKQWPQVNGGNIKSVRNIKERKNSVPEHIQNCVNIERPKAIKPILVSGIAVEETEPNSGEQSEHKSVKFSDDTVFNDGRPNKYRRDTKMINLREIYKGKVNSDYALAKPNPIFVDDNGVENSLTDDEKVARSWGQAKGYKELPTCSNEDMTLSPKSLIPRNKETETHKSEEAVDIESVETEEKPRYDRLIKRTIARQRRSKLIRLVFAFLAFLVVIAAVVLLVIYFGKS